MLSRSLILLVLASSLEAQGLSTQLSQVDASRFPAIGVLLGVFSGAGQPVPGLTKDDFTVTEDGQKVAVLAVEIAKTPISLALVLDNSGSMKGSMEALKSAAADFLRNLDPSDRVMLINFSDKPIVRHELTTNRKDLIETVNGLEPEGATSLYDAMCEAVQGLRRVEGRKLVVVFTDGRDRNAAGTAPQSARNAKAAAKLSREVGAPLWTIGLGKEVDRKLLGKIAEVTGGRSYDAENAGDLRKAFSDILTDVRLQYRLTYGTPKEKRDGSWRTLQVTSAKQGQSGQGRTRYQAPSTAAEPPVASANVVVPTKVAPAPPPAAPSGAAAGASANANVDAGAAGNINIGGLGGNINIDAGGVKIQGPNGTIDIGTGGVNVQAGGASVEVGAGGVSVQGPSGSVEVQGTDADTLTDEMSVETPDASVNIGPGGIHVESDGNKVDVDSGGVNVEANDGTSVEVNGSEE